MTAQQTTALRNLETQHGPVYWPSTSLRPSGLLDVTFKIGAGFVIEPWGEVRAA